MPDPNRHAPKGPRWKRWTITLYPSAVRSPALDVYTDNTYVAQQFMEQLLNIAGCEAYAEAIDELPAEPTS